MTLQEIVANFHHKFFVPVKASPELPSQDRRDRRSSFLEEEFQEYLEAEAANDLVAIADALGDMVYVIVGTCLEYGIPFDDVMAEIHRSNMTKSPSEGKMLKGPDYSPPDLYRVLQKAQTSARIDFFKS